MRHSIAMLRYANATPPLECEQHAGDVMFVPSFWGHAVINVRTAVGIALEFDHAWLQT